MDRLIAHLLEESTSDADYKHYWQYCSEYMYVDVERFIQSDSGRYLVPCRFNLLSALKSVVLAV